MVTWKDIKKIETLSLNYSVTWSLSIENKVEVTYHNLKLQVR